MVLRDQFFKSSHVRVRERLDTFGFTAEAVDHRDTTEIHSAYINCLHTSCVCVFVSVCGVSHQDNQITSFPFLVNVYLWSSTITNCPSSVLDVTSHMEF